MANSEIHRNLFIKRNLLFFLTLTRRVGGDELHPTEDAFYFLRLRHVPGGHACSYIAFKFFTHLLLLDLVKNEMTVFAKKQLYTRKSDFFQTPCARERENCKQRSRRIIDEQDPA